MTKGERTRRKIVADAAPVFNTRGYEGSSLNDLMSATGLKKGGIYRHFASKEALAAEAFDYAWAAALECREPSADAKANGVTWLKELIDNFVTRRPAVAGGCPLLNTAIEADDGNALLRARVSRALQLWTAQLETVVTRAMRRRQMRRAPIRGRWRRSSCRRSRAR
jgi:TetR/AcrR family transcriptional repressor of nem operon